MSPDWIGLFFLYLSISYPVFGLFLSLLFCLLRLDPISFFVALLDIRVLQTSFLATFVRHAIIQLQIQWTLLNGRACIFLAVAMVITLYRLLEELRVSKNLTIIGIWKKVKTYRELYVLLSVVAENGNKLIGHTLSVLFLMVTVANCCIFYDFDNQSSIVSAVFIVIILICFCFGILVFKLGCLLNEESKAILRNFQVETKLWNGFRGKQLQKTVKALQFLYVKAGSISAITVSLKQGYFDALLQDSISLLLLVKDQRIGK